MNLRFEVHRDVHNLKPLNSLSFVNIVNIVNLFRAHPPHVRARVRACVKGRKNVHHVHDVHICLLDQWVACVNIGFECSQDLPNVHKRPHPQVDQMCPDTPQQAQAST